MSKRQNNQEQESDEHKEEFIPVMVSSSPTVGKRHNWRQQGPHLVCVSCESQHGYRIGTGKRMVGVDDQGNPKLANAV